MSTDGPHWRPPWLIGLAYCAILISPHFHIYSPLEDWCLHLVLLGHIISPPSRTSCSCFFFPFVYYHANTIFIDGHFSWVAPIMAPFDIGLDTLKMLLTAWGKYRTSVIFTVYSNFIFMFTKPFSSHFIFWPFPTVTFISHFSTSAMSFLLYILCNDGRAHLFQDSWGLWNFARQNFNQY